MLERLREPFPATKVYQREGPGGKKLDYVAGETVIERFLTVAPDFSWSGRIVSIEEGRAVVEGHLSVGEKSGYGVGSAKMGADLDSSLKAANTEALKNAAKNGFGVALELWDAGHRESLQLARNAAGGSEAALKKAVFDLAKKQLNKAKPSVTEVAKLFKVEAGELSDRDTLSRILTDQGVI